MASNYEKLKCAERELRLRRHVYPRWVHERRMTQKSADHEIAIMEDIVADYQRFVYEDDTKERPQLPFDANQKHPHGKH